MDECVFLGEIRESRLQASSIVIVVCQQDDMYFKILSQSMFHNRRGLHFLSYR